MWCRIWCCRANTWPALGRLGCQTNDKWRHPIQLRKRNRWGKTGTQRKRNKTQKNILRPSKKTTMKLCQIKTHPYRVNVWLVTRESLATHSVANVPKLKIRQNKKRQLWSNKQTAESNKKLTLAEASQAPDTNVRISGERERDMTSPVCPVKDVVCCPVSMSHRALRDNQILLRLIHCHDWKNVRRKNESTRSYLQSWWQFGCHRGNGSSSDSPCVPAIPGWLERCLRVFSGCQIIYKVEIHNQFDCLK
jgi:hypothetical protein